MVDFEASFRNTTVFPLPDLAFIHRTLRRLPDYPLDRKCDLHYDVSPEEHGHRVNLLCASHSYRPLPLTASSGTGDLHLTVAEQARDIAERLFNKTLSFI